LSYFGRLDFGVCQRGDPDRIPGCSTGDLWWRQYSAVPRRSHPTITSYSPQPQYDTYQKDKRAKAGTVHRSSAVFRIGVHCYIENVGIFTAAWLRNSSLCCVPLQHWVGVADVSKISGTVHPVLQRLTPEQRIFYRLSN